MGYVICGGRGGEGGSEKCKCRAIHLKIKNVKTVTIEHSTKYGSF